MQAPGVPLVALSPGQLARLDLPEPLCEAVRAAPGMRAHGARMRQMQYIGKLRRQLEPAVLASVRAALAPRGAGTPPSQSSSTQGVACLMLQGCITPACWRAVPVLTTVRMPGRTQAICRRPLARWAQCRTQGAPGRAWSTAAPHSGRRPMMKPAWQLLKTNLLLLLAFGLFLYGVCAPLMTVQHWFLFGQTVSFLSGLTQLWQAGDAVLCLLLLTCGLLLPLVKIGLVAVVSNTPAWQDPRVRRPLHWLALCGKWSMLEVFIGAVLVVVGQGRGFVAVDVHAGLSALAASVLLVHLATCRLDTRVQRRAADHTTGRNAARTSDS